MQLHPGLSQKNRTDAAKKARGGIRTHPSRKGGGFFAKRNEACGQGPEKARAPLRKPAEKAPRLLTDAVFVTVCGFHAHAGLLSPIPPGPFRPLWNEKDTFLLYNEMLGNAIRFAAAPAFSEKAPKTFPRRTAFWAVCSPGAEEGARRAGGACPRQERFSRCAGGKRSCGERAFLPPRLQKMARAARFPRAASCILRKNPLQ